jgi:hypothetical protein
VFSKGRHDDLVDSMTQALLHLRNHGIVQMDEEMVAKENGRLTHRPRPKDKPDLWSWRSAAD